VNPLTGIIGIVGMASSLLGMGTSTAFQVAQLHQQLKPPAQVTQAQQCVAPYQPVVIIDEQGQRKVMCAEAVQP